MNAIAAQPLTPAEEFQKLSTEIHELNKRREAIGWELAQISYHPSFTVEESERQVRLRAEREALDGKISLLCGPWSKLKEKLGG